MATISGVAFSAFLFGVFTVSEHFNKKTASGQHHELEQFRVSASEELTATEMEVRPGNILVAVRDPKNLSYLRDVLVRTDTVNQDVVVMTARVIHREHSFSGNESMDSADIFEQYEQELFTVGCQFGGEGRQARLPAGRPDERCI